MSSRLALEDLTSGDFDTVILATPDMQGRLVGKRMAPQLFVDRASTGMHLCTCAMAWDIEQGLEGLELEFAGHHTGWHDMLVRPDLSTLRVAGWAESTAVCIGDAIDEQTGELVAIAPRTVLRRQIDALAEGERHALVASELEFFLFHDTYEQARDGNYATLRPTNARHANFSIQHGEAMEPFFRDLRAVLARSDLPTEYAETEYGCGQWEINLAYAPALEMADRHILFKLAVKAVAARHGMSATFMPRPFAHDLGSSCHLHVSLVDGTQATTYHDPDEANHASAELYQSLGGILQHAGELMVFYAPTINAYKRTSSEEFAGRGATWGYDNRTVSSRVIGTSPSSMRLEFRVPGADVNPYLGVAALLASVRAGIDKDADPGEPVVGNAYATDVELLPGDLATAAERFAASPFVASAFGEDVQRHYAAVARFEVEAFSKAVTDWERDRYYESI